MAGEGIPLWGRRALTWWPTRLGRRAATAVVVLATLAGCGSDGSGPASGNTQPGQAMPSDERQALRTSGAPATLSDLRHLDELKALFNQHQDVPQLVLLLSPT